MTRVGVGDEASARRARAARLAGLVVLGCVPVLNVLLVGLVYDRMGRVIRGDPTEPALSGPTVARWARLGVLGLLGSGALLAVPGFLLLAGWTVGWIVSFERASLDYAWLGPTLVALSTIALAGVLLVLPAAQTHFARRESLRAFLDVSTVLGLVRADPGGVVAAAFTVLGFRILHRLYRVLIFLELASFVPLVLWNAMLIGLYVLVRTRWAARHARLAAAPAGTQVPWWARGSLLAAALLIQVVTIYSFFMVSFGPSDFLLDPLLGIPTAPYPGGGFLPDALPGPAPGRGP